jgi:regulator of RNase E activity RraA
MLAPLEPLSTCDLSDACDELGVAACRSGAIRPAWPGCPSLLGPLATLRLEPANYGTPLPELLGVLPQAAGKILFVDLEGRVDLQCWGSVLASAARYHGVYGAIVNGATRDVGGLAELEFPTYASGVVPVRVKGRLRFAGFAVPVTIDDVVVEPEGWYAAADANGVVLFPQDDLARVLALAREREAREREQREAVLAGADPSLFLAS